ncbi:hypothetical protein J6590_047728 [Homalodisca vitripennis]|nr:hypothetical protein J6590_047728 [Homalodisca vitripennis]
MRGKMYINIGTQGKVKDLIPTDLLQSIQSRFIRLVGYRLGHRYADVPVNSLAAELGLQPLALRRKIFDLVFLYKLVNGDLNCPQLLERVRFHVPTSTRSSNLFARLHHSTNYERNSTMVRIQTLGNTLPLELDIFNTGAVSFKRQINQLLSMED